MVKFKIDNNRSFQVAKVIEHIMLNCVDINSNKNKFYETKIEISPNGDYRIMTRHGRVGEEGKTNYRYPEYYADLYDTQDACAKMLNAKKNKGYVQIDVETETKKVSKVDTSKLNEFDRIITQIYDEAVRTVHKHVKTPLGKLSKDQIRRTQSILDSIYQALNSNASFPYLERLSSSLYANLPQETTNRLVRLPIIDSFDKLNRQIELLKVIETLVNVQGAIDKDAKEKYLATGATMELLSPRTKEYKRLVKMVKDTQSKHHTVDIIVKNILKLEIKGEKEKFNPKGCKTMELFHGSRNANILNIIESGLKIKPKTAIHTGSMFGGGIYFASDSTKSSQYSARNSDNHYDQAYLFVADVATGKIKDYDTAQPHLNDTPKGYDSVRGVTGRQLLHDEYIVYNDNQVQMKYMIEFETKRRRR